ncbi:family 20 glycosylhydrolase [Flavihumibacter sp. R14]|nr:family 20 glycosylhydrolase [Flavihumibacter soli]
MKKLLLPLFIFCLISFGANAQTDTPKIAIIPEPVSMVVHEGQFKLPKNVIIQSSKHPGLLSSLALLEKRFSAAPSRKVIKVHEPSDDVSIRFILNAEPDTVIGKEGYRLAVTPENITIRANEPAGIFYGSQTLLQLFPAEIESKELAEHVKWTAPAVNIADYPRVGWRGLMFDVSRHFFTKDEVKQYIDAMVRYKYNLLHFHLTDDEGWRIEIKGLPRLTEVGAWNVKRVGEFGNFIPPTADEPRNYGGFYTQEDIKELVKYAQERFVNILPEIDVPGHSLAAIASYPELSCTEGADQYRVRSGEQIMDWSKGAPPIALVDNTLCPANEKVYEFLDKVISQVAELFPFEYIHMGGDEAPINFWQKSEAIKALMKSENLKDMHAVQGYFTKRVEKIVRSKGKKFIGWDEIMEGGLDTTATIMSWRGIKNGMEAANKHHEVVMSPTTYAYLDYMQSDKLMEPKVYASLRLSESYKFDPIPEGVNPRYIKGGQGNLWTEQVYNIRQAEYMTWPRGFALAESLWSPKEKKNWKHFFSRVETHFGRFNAGETKYAPSVYDPIFNVKAVNNRLYIDLATEVEGLDIYYSFDNSYPDRFYPKYTESLLVPIDASQFRVITYKGKTPVGRMITMPVSELKNRLPKGTRLVSGS